MNKLIVGNLLHRPVRTVITMLAVGIEVVMILSIVGLLIGQVTSSRNQNSGIGADIIVRPPNASFISAVGGAPVPAKVATVLAKLPHVAVVSPAISDLNTVGSVETIWGIDYASYNALRPFVFLAGGPFQGPNDVIVDDEFARTDHGYHVGDTIQIKAHPFRITGIFEHGKGGRKFVPIHTLGTLIGTPDNASVFYIRADNPANADLIKSEISHYPGLGSYSVMSLAELMSLLSADNYPGLKPALDSVIAIAVIVGFLVIFQSMYTAVLERTREIGILKSLGASRGFILGSVLREAALVAVMGLISGVLLTLALHAALFYKYPTRPFFIPPIWWVRSLIIAFVGATLGAMYPAWKAASKDPIDALAYE